MGGNMRRSDREITDKKIIDAFITGEQVLRVAFYDQGDIYLVPVNYGFLYEEDTYTFYFHGAKAGRKYELSKCEPTVGFEIDGNYKLAEGETACNFSALFQSVIGTRTVHIVTDKAEKIRGLNAIMKQATQKSEWDYHDKMIESVAVFRIDVDKISCKSH
jgi:hypothetical protein